MPSTHPLSTPANEPVSLGPVRAPRNHTHLRDLARETAAALHEPYQRCLLAARAARAAYRSLPADPEERIALVAQYLRAGSATAAHDIHLGVGPSSESVTLPLDDLRTHMLISGAVGAGTSVALNIVLDGLLDSGWDGTVLDLIDDDVLAERCRAALGRFHGGTLGAAAWIDPLRGLGAGAVSALVLSLCEIDDHYWAALCERVIEQVAALCLEGERTPGDALREMVRVLGSDDLAAATLTLRKSSLEPERYGFLATSTSEESHAARLIGAVLRQLIDGPDGTKLRGDVSAELDPLGPGVSYVGLNAHEAPLVSRLIAGGVLTRHATRRAGPPRFLVINAVELLDAKMLSDLLARARAASVAVILRESGWGSVPPSGLVNINSRLVMHQNGARESAGSAEFLGAAELADSIRHLHVGEAFFRLARAERIESVALRAR